MARIQLRRDTTANWAAADPTLAEGEQGLDTTTGDLYIGDGVTAFTALAPFQGNLTDYYTQADVNALLSLKADVVSVYTKDEVDALGINSLSDVVVDSPNNDQVLAFDGLNGEWKNKTIYANVAYNTEDDAKAAGKNEGDVYYNSSFSKTLIIGASQIPAKKSQADAGQGEVYYNQDTNQIESKGVRTVTVNAGNVEADATTTEPRGTLGWDPNPAVMYISSGSFWIKIGQGRADA